MNKKILIVRGDRRNAKALSFLLAGSGYQISSHATAGEAVEAARHQRFDLAITDEELPENQPNLTLVSSLREAQPTLPIFYLAQKQSVETVISCIRAGVTEVLSDPSDIKKLIETTNAFLRGKNDLAQPDEVTWEDILAVEQMLESTNLASKADATRTGKAPVSSAEVIKLQEKLEHTLSDRDRITGELAMTLANLDKSKRLIEELKNANGNASTDSEVAERAAELDKKELRLKEMSAKLSQQKFEVESQLAELEAQQVEFEEAQKDARPAAGGAEISNAELDEERASFNALRLDLQAQIQDLQRNLEISKQSTSNTEELERELANLREKLQDSVELLAEKDFIIEQRDRELETLKADLELRASNQSVDELEDEKRLIEIEHHKLKEKRDQFDREKRLAEEAHIKNQREIQVERRDAEVSLREMQNGIREEQLKLKVDQASVREEMRQFEQAKQNFQEDVQELQNKQAELRKMESYLSQMEETLKATGRATEHTLPKPESTAFEPLQTNTAQTTPEVETSHQAETPQTDSGEPKDPNQWGKPDMDKKAGRGPLRIGRRSSF